MFEPLTPPDCDPGLPGSDAWLPPRLPPEEEDEDCEPPGEGIAGIDDPEPLRPEDGEGRPALRPEPPELEEEPPLEPPEDPPEDDGDELGEGIEGDDDC